MTSQQHGDPIAGGVTAGVGAIATQHAADMSSWDMPHRTTPVGWTAVARTTRSASAAMPPDARMRIMVFLKS
jgi:hypothetical protein